MNELATKAEIDALCKQVHDLKELAENRSAEMQAKLPDIVKEILKNHPGRTPQRRIVFATPETQEVDEVFDRMPKDLIEQHDQAILAAKILGKPVNELKMWGKWCRKAGEFKAALDTATASEGTEWVPTEFSANLIDKVHAELKVMALFPSFDMPSKVYEFPIELGDIDTWGQPENTASTGQTAYGDGLPAVLTGKVTFTSKAHVAQVYTSRELTEDSIVPALPFLYSRLVRGIALGREDVAVNGDTTGTHMDYDTNLLAATHRQKYWMGLRASAYHNSYTTDLSTFSNATLRGQRAKMGVYGMSPSKLAYVCSLKTYLASFLELDDVATVDKYGANAVILKGELGNVDGIPIIPSEKVRDDLNASGVDDNVTATKSALNLVYRDGFMVGNRRAVGVQLLREVAAQYGQFILLVDERFAFRDTYPIASNRTTDLGINF
jgi:HK97 family phage major capsid protein